MQKNNFNKTCELKEKLNSRYYSKDLAPVPIKERTWNYLDITALWIGLSVCIPTYMLASSLIVGGMNWWQAIFTIFLGNLIILIPMILNAHAGTKYGIPFPVFARAPFGLNGANIPALLRAIVGCGWFGILCWIGGSATHQLLSTLIPAWKTLPVLDLGFIGSQPLGAWLGFLIFWAVNFFIVIRGIESIRFLEKLAAPFLLIVGLTLLVWAWFEADGFGPMLSTPSKFATTKDFLLFFFPALTGMVGYWATLSLNIPDFTRYAKSQKDQIIGQVLGLNITMPLCAFVGVAVTSATVVIFGRQIWDPIELMAQFNNPFVVVIAMSALWIATLTTNLAGNVVAPSNGFSNLMPRLISFRTGGIITCILGILIMPWKLISDPTGYIFVWLLGYSALLGPIAGILIADYIFCRKTKYNLRDMYIKKGIYYYKKGYNPAAMWALAIAILINIPGFLVEIKIIEKASAFSIFTDQIYHYAWFIGFFVAFTLYLIFMKYSSKDKVVK